MQHCLEENLAHLNRQANTENVRSDDDFGIARPGEFNVKNAIFHMTRVRANTGDCRRARPKCKLFETNPVDNLRRHQLSQRWINAVFHRLTDTSIDIRPSRVEHSIQPVHTRVIRVSRPDWRICVENRLELFGKRLLVAFRLFRLNLVQPRQSLFRHRHGFLVRPGILHLLQFLSNALPQRLRVCSAKHHRHKHPQRQPEHRREPRHGNLIKHRPR